MQARQSGIVRNIAAVGTDPALRRQRGARLRPDHIEQMQLIAFDRGVAARRKPPCELRTEAFGINAERILRLKSGPLGFSRPVTVAERMALHSRRGEMQEELRDMAEKRLDQK